jgi:serine/threonine protein kinase
VRIMFHIRASIFGMYKLSFSYTSFASPALNTFSAPCPSWLTLHGQKPHLRWDLIYTDLVDIWALGVLAYETLEEKCPFEKPTKKGTIAHIQSGEVVYPEWMSSEAVDFIKSTWRKVGLPRCLFPTSLLRALFNPAQTRCIHFVHQEASKRPSADSLKTHPWILAQDGLPLLTSSLAPQTLRSSSFMGALTKGRDFDLEVQASSHSMTLGEGVSGRPGLIKGLLGALSNGRGAGVVASPGKGGPPATRASSKTSAATSGEVRGLPPRTGSFSGMNGLGSVRASTGKNLVLTPRGICSPLPLTSRTTG